MFVIYEQKLNRIMNLKLISVLNQSLLINHENMKIQFIRRWLSVEFEKNKHRKLRIEYFFKLLKNKTHLFTKKRKEEFKI